MRRNVGELHEKINARLMTTFKGTLEERMIKTDSAGTEFLVNKYQQMRRFNILEIPVSIYTPTDVRKDKLGIYFHGGGKILVPWIWMEY